MEQKKGIDSLMSESRTFPPPENIRLKHCIGSKNPQNRWNIHGIQKIVKLNIPGLQMAKLTYLTTVSTGISAHPLPRKLL